MGCRICRARKVKCDGRPNGCRNCERLRLDCVSEHGGLLPDGRLTSSAPPAAVSLRKIRTYRSCQNCRLSKTKCNGDRPKCARCRAKDAECIYDGGASPRWTKSLKIKSEPLSLPVDTASLGMQEQGKLVTDDEPAGTVDALGDVFLQSNTMKFQGNDMENIVASLPQEEDEHIKTVASPGPHSLSWLLSPELPEKRNLRRVVEHYFANVHPLRCFAFVHKPSFIRQLDKGLLSDDESALLYIICAHGAKFLVLSSSEGETALSLADLRAAGNQWAKRAEYLTLANFGKISVQLLMTAILLHDFYFRLGEYGQALMISGLAVRMAHALKINTEYSADILCTESDSAAPSVAARESRRRLMWACYVLDAWVGSGVDQLTLLRENDIKIQLPCNERNFGLRIPTVTETLGVGHVLQFLPPAVVPRQPTANMGIMACYIRVVALWKRIVRYVSHLHLSPPPWQPDSHYAALDADLHLWRRELPDFVEYSSETVYARLDSNQLGALVLIHCTYHHNFLELYKIVMPDLFKLAKPFAFPMEQQEFLRDAQANCYYHARQITDILSETAEHGARLLSDSLLPFFVYDSSRVLLYYVARLLHPTWPDATAKWRDAIKAVESNNCVLRLMARLFPMAQSLSTTIERWLSKIQQSTNQEDLVSSLQSEHRLDAHRSEILSKAQGNTVQTSSECMLPPPHSLAQNGGSVKRYDDEFAACNPASWSTANPNANNSYPVSWDGTSIAAHQLLGLSQEAVPLRSGLQHERPVSMQPLQGSNLVPQPMCETLDLDDLQNFLSWDMYGIMEIDGGLPNDELDDSLSQSWTGAI